MRSELKFSKKYKQNFRDDLLPIVLNDVNTEVLEYRIGLERSAPFHTHELRKSQCKSFWYCTNSVSKYCTVTSNVQKKLQ